MNAAEFATQFNHILAIELETQTELAHARRAAAKTIRHFADASHRVSKNEHPALRLLTQFLNKSSPILNHALNLHLPKQKQSHKPNTPAHHIQNHQSIPR